MKRYRKKLIAGRGLLAVVSVVLVGSMTAQPAGAANTPVTDQQIIHYVRERFGIPDTTKLTVAPFQDSEYKDFYQTTIYVQTGKEKKSQSAFVTKDGHYLVIGLVFAASSTVQHAPPANASATDQKIVDFVRTKFHVPDAVKLSVGPFRDSEYKDFYQTTIYGQDGEKRSAQSAYVTKDGRYTVIGSIFNLSADPRSEVERTISLNDQPSVGPANAPVTIVEYADLECPTCAEMQKFIEGQLIPKYGNKIRIIFKEFPLVTIHDWTLTASIANECGYQLNPADYFHYRSIIFASQGMINAANVRTLLLDFGQRAGYSRLKLATCLDSKASLPRIEADMREGQQLGVMSTPTLFINGTPVVGLSPPRIYQVIDKALQAAR
jgi:protein-disulfide isomerase